MKSLAVLNDCGFNKMHIDYLKKRFPDSVFYSDTSSENSAIERVGQRNIVIMDQFMFQFSEQFLKQCTNIELIILNTTAYDNINLSLLNKYGIQLANLADYATEDVTEVALSMMLALNNHSQKAQEIVLKDDVYEIYPGHKILKSIKRYQLSKQIVGIIGLGKIGQSIAKKCTALGLKVLGYSRSIKTLPDVEQVPLKELCTKSDIIIISLSYKRIVMDQFIDKKLLSTMKKGSILISVAHPDLIDLDYLIHHHEKFRGIGFDYVVTPKIIELLRSRDENIIITPQLGSQSKQAMDKMTKTLMQTALEFAGMKYDPMLN